jgi:RNA methyltransferase, TrmH family
MNKKLTSVNNKEVKGFYQLTLKSKRRKISNTFLIEGLREIKLAIQHNWEIKQLLFCPQIISEENLNESIENETEKIEVSQEIYDKLAYRNSTEGVIAITNCKNHDLKNIKFKSNNPLIIVIEATEKPGNIGAILRTADAANIDAVIIANPKTDLYNPNVIRSSVGSIFTNNIYVGNTKEIISLLKNKNIKIFASSLQTDELYHNQDYTKSCALIIGTEDKGISKDWAENSFKNIKIPMKGEIDSLNLSNAASILIYEALRQRNFT